MRIPLSFAGGRLHLYGAIHSKRLRVPRQMFDCIIDTGSVRSFLSPRDVLHMQIPQSGDSRGRVAFAGAVYDQIKLPAIMLDTVQEDRRISSLQVNFSALKTARKARKNIQTAESLPSILGMDFLMENRLSLHVFPNENIAYLQG